MVVFVELTGPYSPDTELLVSGVVIDENANANVGSTLDTNDVIDGTSVTGAGFENNTVIHFSDGSTVTGDTGIYTLDDGRILGLVSALGVRSGVQAKLEAGLTIHSMESPINSIESVGGLAQDTHYMLDNAAIAAAICFARDTMIDTDQGEVAVQDLTVGMMVRTRDNGMQPIRWIGMSPIKDRAVRIKAGAMGNTRDLVVSPRHRMVLDGWQLEMLFDHDHALVTAVELVNDDTIVRDAMADVEYYHVMFDQHEVIYAEGAATESFHPDQASMGSMDAAARAEILALFPDLRGGNARAETAPSLSVTQAAYVAKNIGDFVS